MKTQTTQEKMAHLKAVHERMKKNSDHLTIVFQQKNAILKKVTEDLKNDHSREDTSHYDNHHLGSSRADHNHQEVVASGEHNDCCCVIM